MAAFQPTLCLVLDVMTLQSGRIWIYRGGISTRTTVCYFLLKYSIHTEKYTHHEVSEYSQTEHIHETSTQNKK